VFSSTAKIFDFYAQLLINIAFFLVYKNIFKIKISLYQNKYIILININFLNATNE